MQRVGTQWVGAAVAVMTVGSCLACSPVYATAPQVEPDRRAVARAFPGASPQALESVYSGFGQGARGGGDGPVFWVDTVASAGPGSLRSALGAAEAAGGGVVLFAVGGDIALAEGVDVPANTTLDGLSAPAPGVTLWGDAVTGGRGVINVFESNVIVRGLRVRNAANDGIQIAPKRGASIRDIVIDHCSVTNSADGGIDVTGLDGLVVTDVTLSWNYIAGSGSVCPKGTCGGGALIKYGVDRISVHANLWDKNLRRNPTIDGGATPGGTLGDVRGNVVRQYEQSGVQVVAGARANVIGNFFDRPHAVWYPDGTVFMAGNANGEPGNMLVAFPVTIPITPVSEEAVLSTAGALPRDELDDFYMHDLSTWAAMKAAGTQPVPSPTPPSPTPAPTVVWLPTSERGALEYPLPVYPPREIDDAALMRARAFRRTARIHARARTRRDEALRAYGDVMRTLQGATGPLAPRARGVMIQTELDLARLHRRRVSGDPGQALQHARAAHGRCMVGPCTSRYGRRAVRDIRRAERRLARSSLPIPPWRPPAY